MNSSKILTLAALLLAGAACGVQAAEIPLSSAAQPCVEHYAFNNGTGNQDIADASGHSTHRSATHCLTSIQSSDDNKLFGNNDLYK